MHKHNNIIVVCCSIDTLIVEQSGHEKHIKRR